MLLDFIKKTTTNVVNVAKPIIEKASTELFEGFADSTNSIINRISVLADSTVGEEADKLSLSKKYQLQTILKTLTMTLNELLILSLYFLDNILNKLYLLLILRLF